MPAPRIAIVGRPNVGKSSLLNLIARERISIVDPTPGVTRDRVSVLVELDPPDDRSPRKPIELTDTGGFGVYTAEGRRYDEVGADLASLTGDIEHQIAEAVTNADLILFAIDAQAGITPQDQLIAKLLREQKLGDRRARSGSAPDTGGLVPVQVVATKTDDAKWEPHAYELAALGFGEPIMVSSTTKYMRRDMLDKLYALVDHWSPTDDDPDELETDLRLAIVGKRNAGKSTLVNTLAGEPRVIVSEIAGTTRDAVDVRFTLPDGRRVTAIDTAGLRRKSSFQDRVEWYAYERSQRAIDRADAVLLLIDATREISQVDEQLAALVVKSLRPVVIVVNKWDEAQGRKNQHGKTVTPEDYEGYIRRELGGLSFAPIAFMSAKTGLNVRAVLDIAFELRDQSRARVGTGELNRFFKEVVEQHSPPSLQGQFGRVFYATQVKTDPPTIVVIVNRVQNFSGSYERYVINRVRDELPFGEVPVRLIFRSRKRAELAALKAGRAGRRDLAERRMHATDAASQGFVGDLDQAEAFADLFRDLPDDAAAYFDADEDETDDN